MIHVTRDGNRIPIALMTDDHLYNTIMYLLRQLEEAKDVINGKKLLENIDDFTRSISLEERYYDEDYYKERAKEITEMLANYILEATIRGMDFREQLQKAFGRDKGLNSTERKWIEIEEPSEKDSEKD